MGDGKALQMGTSHELGQNFATVVRHRLPRRHRRAADRVDHVVGLVHPHGRRADHGPRRRQRPARAARGSRPSRWSCSRCATRATSSRAAARSPTSCAPRACARSSTPRPTCSMGRRATDWELKGVPVRLEVGPRDLADGVATLVRRIAAAREDAQERSVALDGVAATVRRRARAPAGRVARPRPPTRSASRAPPTSPRSTTRATPRRPDGRASRGTPSAPRARPSSRRAGVTVRCLVRADGSLPDDDQEPDLVAYVGVGRTDR